MTQPAQPKIDFSQFYQQEDVGERKSVPNFKKSLQSAIDDKIHDKVEIMHAQPYQNEKGHYSQDIIGFTGSKEGKEHHLYLHFTPEEEKKYRKQLKEMLRKHIKEIKEERV